MAVGNAPLGKVVGRNLDGDLVTRRDFDEVLAHSAGDMGEKFVPADTDNADERIYKNVMNWLKSGNKE